MLRSPQKSKPPHFVISIIYCPFSKFSQWHIENDAVVWVDGHGRHSGTFIFKAGCCPATSWANAAWTVNWFSGKFVKLVPADVRFQGQNALNLISAGAPSQIKLGELTSFPHTSYCCI